MAVKFSILIPAYKKTFLESAINSCLNQTFHDLEVIIIDDCSPDNLYSVVQGISDERVYYYRNETNIGAIDLVDNWNRCLYQSTGDFVICMGDDDMLLPNSLEVYWHLICKYPTLDVYHARTAMIDEKGAYTDIVPSRSEYENILEFMRHRLEGWSQFIGDFCYRAETLKAAGGFFRQPLAWGSDDLTAYSMIGHKGIANTQEVAFLYRHNPWSISSASYTDIKMTANVTTFAWIRDLLDRFDCSTVEEKITKDVLTESLYDYKQDFQAAILCQCFKQDKWKCFSYLMHKNKYEVSATTVLKALFSSMLM